LKKMLVVDPEQRITVKDALEHPYLQDLHDADDEPETDALSPHDFDFELYDLSYEQLKDLLFDEILLYHDEHKL